jgi:hypothetical protein
LGGSSLINRSRRYCTQQEIIKAILFNPI